eukprot:TRINITY_DN66270_c0_g1_i1.p1 TRINITY_DN66270_c0_g1~~TRINITY_DN66270_c0_g1_i1.p1  ORF type:complete len:267 (+),score=73.88 TRINITY_DN66270_c0_g1_i1:91-801(+)
MAATADSGGSALIAFARLPVPGKVKTRLAKGVGPEQAARFYKLCAERVLGEAAASGVGMMYVFFSVAEEKPGVDEWMAGIGLSPELRPQCASPDLGDRMREAFTEVFAAGAGRALIVGTDIPDLDRAVVARALSALDEHDLVIGPAEDGGYYLLGLKGVCPELFKGIEWSTDSVRSRTLEIARQHGLKAAPLDTLPTLRDMDLRSDLQAWHDGAAEGHPLRRTASEILAASVGSAA